MLNSWMNRGFEVQQDDKVGLGAKRKPVIGLALGGGSARGFAHIGILRALMAHVILFSYSRGGMLALAVTGAVAFVLIPKGPRHYLALLIAIALMIRLAISTSSRNGRVAFSRAMSSAISTSASTARA